MRGSRGRQYAAASGTEDDTWEDVMHPSSITPIDTQTRTAGARSSLLIRGSSGTTTVRQTHPHARGPLATRALRLLGISAAGQAYSGWSGPALQVALGSGWHGTSLAQPWLAARTMPTPQGHLRAR